MTFHTQLRIPGPTPLPERVVRSMNRPMIDHRGPEFAAILAEITAGAKRVFKTKHDLLLLTCSGTGGLESAVANLVSQGDEVVVALSGNFGERFAALAAAYGADVTRLEFEWGQPVDPDDLARVLERHPKAGVVDLGGEPRMRRRDDGEVRIDALDRGWRIILAPDLLSGLAAGLVAGPAGAQASATTDSAGPELSLEDAQRIAQRNNPVFLQSVDARRSSAAAVRTAYGGLLPRLTASLGATYQEAGQQILNGISFGTGSNTLQSDYQFALTYELSGATLLGPSYARANDEAAEADVSGQREVLQSNVSQQYLNVLQTRARADLNDSLVIDAQAQLELVGMGFEDAEHRETVELSSVVLADGCDWIPSAHHVISLLEPQHHNARGCAEVVDLDGGRAVETAEEAVEHVLPDIAEAFHAGGHRDVRVAVAGGLEQDFQVPRAHHADVCAA